MPCKSYYDDYPQQYYKDTTEPGYQKQISFAESALCQTLAALEKTFEEGDMRGNFYDVIDYEAAGITRAELVDWHTKHKELDAKHRAEEAAAVAARKAKQAKAALKKAVLATLSAEQIDALGLK